MKYSVDSMSANMKAWKTTENVDIVSKENKPGIDIIVKENAKNEFSQGVEMIYKQLVDTLKNLGVEPIEAASMSASLEAGEIVTLETTNTIADGTAVKTVGKIPFEHAKENVDMMLTVEDDELIGAFLDMVENHKMVVENSGLLTVAALKQLDLTGKKVVAILSGGNMDVITMSSIVQHGLIQRDRIFSVSVLLPDKPGELVKIVDAIKENKDIIHRTHC